MTDVRVFTGDPGLATLLANGSGFNVILQAQRRLSFATGEGVLGLVGAVVNDRGAPGRAVELDGKVDDLRTRYGGFKSHLGDGPATGYEGNLYARAKGLDAPRVVLMPVDLALKDKTITDATAVDLKVKLARGARTFTVEADDDVFTTEDHGLAVDDTIQLVTLSGGTGAAVATTYYVISVPDADTFTLSATEGGSSLAITLDGSGTWRPISMAGADFGPRTIPAGSRLATSGNGYVVRLLEDVVWGQDEYGAKDVRFAKVSGTEAAINTLGLLAADYTSILADETAEGTALDSVLCVCTTATTVPDAVDAAELLLRYEYALDAMLDSPAGQAVNVVVADRDESGIGDLVAAHCVEARSRGYFRRCVVAPPVGTTAANARLTSGDGVGRATLSTTVAAYVHGGVRRAFLEDSANLSADDGYLVTVPGAMAFAARVANTPPWENPARPHQTLRTYGILEIEPVAGLTPATHFRAGIVVPEFTRADGQLAASFRDGIFADGTKIADGRLQDYLADGCLGVLAPYHKAPATLANREAAQDGVEGFLSQLVSEGTIAAYAASYTWDATNDHLRLQVAVDKTGNMDVITLDLLVGGDAVAQSGV